MVLKELKRGEFFKFTAKGKMYVYEGYNPVSKRCCFHNFNDTSVKHIGKPERKVFLVQIIKL